jgi:hypothetical protein
VTTSEPGEGPLSSGGSVQRQPPSSAEPGERRPRLDRPPSDRYATPSTRRTQTGSALRNASPLAAVVLFGALAFTFLGGVLTLTAGLIVVAGFVGWLTGRLVSPPARAAAVAVASIVAGLLGIWLFGRLEGGVLNPIDYFAEVQGILVPLELAAAGGMAAAASR